MQLLILGAGRHGQVVADAALAAARACGGVVPIGFLDDRPDLHGTTVLGLRVLGPLSALSETPHDSVVVAIGDNQQRWRLQKTLRRLGESIHAVIHPSAVLASDVPVGEGAMVLAAAIVNTGSEIGAGAILNTGCTIDHHNRVGAAAHVGPGAHTGGGVRIGTGALVGVGAAIMPDCQIGDWAVVGLGSAVIEDVRAGATVVGVPAQAQAVSRA